LAGGHIALSRHFGQGLGGRDPTEEMEVVKGKAVHACADFAQALCDGFGFAVGQVAAQCNALLATHPFLFTFY
jgi:hypothetical protein